jgi:hypothetical protein
MNNDIANYIVSLIETKPFVDKIAGVVVAASQTVENTVKIFPMACGVQHRECNVGKYNDLVPNSKYKSIIYFEDGGVTFGAVAKNLQAFNSRIRLVGWLNLQKLGSTNCTRASDVIIEILRELPKFPVNEGNFIRLKITAASEVTKNKQIFSKYTYKEEQNQYLIYPYDYFALDLTAEWFMNLDCIREYTPASPILCPKQPS